MWRRVIVLLLITVFLTGCVDKEMFEVGMGMKKEHEEYVLEKYDKSEEWFDDSDGREWVDYCKYYYTSQDEKLFKDSKKYKKIESEDEIQEITKVVNAFCSSSLKEPEKYDFTTDVIEKNDYYALIEKERHFALFYYDVESGILYYLHSVGIDY